MKKFFLSLSVFISLNVIGQDLKIITYNIRFNNPEDGINSWSNRKDNVCGLLRFYDPDIFGLQEALYDQIQYIAAELKNYQWMGVGRDDGDKAGEFSPIFYDSTTLNVINKGWFWLSETPDVPGKGWDAACFRICTWALFSFKENGSQFLVFNTHFDHKGDIARSKSVELVLKQIAEINTDNLPVIFMGDLNLTPESEPVQRVKQVLNDAKETSRELPYGPEGTANGFDYNSPLDKRIDYIFVSGQIEVLKYAVLSDSKNRRYPSDHLPVFAKIRL